MKMQIPKNAGDVAEKEDTGARKIQTKYFSTILHMAAVIAAMISCCVAYSASPELTSLFLGMRSHTARFR